MNPDDPEMIGIQCFIPESEHIQFSSILKHFQYCSDWHRAKKGCRLTRNVKKPANVDSFETLRVKWLSQYPPKR